MAKKVWNWLAPLIVVIVILAIVIPLSLKPAEKEVIKIGAILPLSGSAAFSGEQMRDGMLMAVEEINNKGGINGRKIELLIEDSKGSAQEGVTAFNNLNLKSPNIIISSLSAVSVALVPLAKEKEIPLLVTVVSVPNVAKNEWVFRYYPTAEQEIPPLINIANELKINKIAVLYLNDDFGVSVYNTLKEKFGGTVIGESFPIATGDFRTQITKIKSANPEAILVVGFSSHIVNAVKQIKEFDLNIKIFGLSTMAVPDVRKALGEVGEGIYLTAPMLYNNNVSDETKYFKETFKNRYNKEADHYAATGYDTIKLIEQVIRSSGYSKEAIKEGLTRLQSFTGLLGEAEINGRDISFPLYPARTEGGEIIYLK